MDIHEALPPLTPERRAQLAYWLEFYQDRAVSHHCPYYRALYSDRAAYWEYILRVRR